MENEQIGNAPTPKNPISLLEKDVANKAGIFPGHREKINRLETPIDPRTVKRGKYDDLLTEARKSVLEDENLLATIFQAIVEKTKQGKVIKFAEVENILVEKCINLTEDDIDNTVRQLGKKFLDYVRKDNNRISQVMGNVREELLTGRFNINSRGVKSVVSFVRERTKLLMNRPSQQFIIGFNNRLDANRKIDLIEIIFGETVFIIEQLNFIQIKSSAPTKEEVDDIVRAHHNFANHDILSSEDIKDSELPDQIQIKSVNSIVAVSHKIINQRNVYNSQSGTKGSLAATM